MPLSHNGFGGIFWKAKQLTPIVRSAIVMEIRELAL